MLTLGNKQVLSVLFIVFVLMGVFFAMGYVMGRTAAPAETATRRDPDPPVRSAPAAVLEPAAKPIIETAPSESASIPLATETAATQPITPAVSPSGPAQESPTELAPITVIEPEPGQTFLQVSAVAKPEAEVLAELLQKKGFRTIIAPGPNDKLFRVLVGPTAEPSLIKIRSELEQAGFKPMVRKY